MAREPSFNFGANRKARKPRAKKASSKKAGSGKKSNAWQSYTSGGRIPD